MEDPTNAFGWFNIPIVSFVTVRTYTVKIEYKVMCNLPNSYYFKVYFKVYKYEL